MNSVELARELPQFGRSIWNVGRPGGEHHSLNELEIMFAEVSDEGSRFPDLATQTELMPKAQTVLNETACAVVARFAKDKMCEDCCDQKFAYVALPDQPPVAVATTSDDSWAA